MRNKRTLVFLFLIVCAVYANGLSSGFVWDDNTLIVQKQAFFNNPTNAIRILTSPDAPLGVITPYYRPLNTLTYMLDHYLWGLHPFWYHLENVLIHAIVVMLFYMLLVEVFGDGRFAFISALLFAVYPVNAEAVDFISARNALLCTAFSLACLLFVAKGGLKWTLLSLLAYLLALLSKEPAAVLPFFLLSFALTSGGQWKDKYKTHKYAAAGFFAITAIYFMIRLLILGSFTPRGGIEFSLERLEFVSSVYFENFRLMFFPFELNANYTPEALPFGWMQAAGTVLSVLFLFYFSLARKIPSPVRAGAQWIFWGLLPVSNIIKIPSAPVAERYQYAIIFGFAVIPGYLFSRVQGKKAVAGAAAAAVLALALGLRTFERNFVWKDDISLFSSMIHENPRNAEAYCNLGTFYGSTGNTEEAIGEFEAARSLGYPKAWMNLGIAYTKEGRIEDAITQFKTALAIDPGLTEAMAHLGVAYEQDGRLGEAEREYKTALAIDPGLTETQVNLGVVYAKEGRFDDAVRELKGALAFDPGLDLARMDIGVVYMEEDQLNEAAREFRMAIALNPGNKQAIRYLDGVERRMER